MRSINKNLLLSFEIDQDIELLPFLFKVIQNKSRNSTKSILRRGQVMVNGQIITQHNHPLQTGDQVDILTNKGARKYANLSGVSIVFEDNDILVVNKNSGVLSMGTGKRNEQTAYQQLMDYVKFDHSANRIFIVHRLDRDTSGIMIFAKSKEIQKKLQDNWHTNVKKRAYTALVEGNVKKEKSTIKSWLKETKSFHVYSSSTDNGGKHAVTHYEKKYGNRNYSLMDVELETGRKNQIRVHMQDIGHPIVGDRKYGAKTNPIRRLGLHATTLEFIHPTTEKLVKFTVKPPVSFLNTIK